MKQNLNNQIINNQGTVVEVGLPYYFTTVQPSLTSSHTMLTDNTQSMMESDRTAV